jgi:hypothetical protein
VRAVGFVDRALEGVVRALGVGVGAHGPAQHFAGVEKVLNRRRCVWRDWRRLRL